jgi:hypothetical protein
MTFWERSTSRSHRAHKNLRRPLKLISHRRVAEGRLYRSARPGWFLLQKRCLNVLTLPDDATLSDKNLLRDEYNIKTVMDLRTVYVTLSSLELRTKL